MKKILIIILSAICANSLFAQTLTGSFEALKNMSSIQMEVEFQGIFGMSEEDFAVYEEDWEKDKHEVLSNFTSSVSKGAKDIFFSTRFNTPYKFRVLVNVLTKNEWFCCAILIDEQGNEVGRIDGVNYYFAPIGTQLHCIKRLAEKTGFDLGTTIRQAIRGDKVSRYGDR